MKLLACRRRKQILRLELPTKLRHAAWLELTTICFKIWTADQLMTSMNTPTPSLKVLTALQPWQTPSWATSKRTSKTSLNCVSSSVTATLLMMFQSINKRQSTTIFRGCSLSKKEKTGTTTCSTKKRESTKQQSMEHWKRMQLLSRAATSLWERMLTTSQLLKASWSSLAGNGGKNPCNRLTSSRKRRGKRSTIKGCLVITYEMQTWSRTGSSVVGISLKRKTAKFKLLKLLRRTNLEWDWDQAQKKTFIVMVEPTTLWSTMAYTITIVRVR